MSIVALGDVTLGFYNGAEKAIKAFGMVGHAEVELTMKEMVPYKVQDKSAEGSKI